MSRLHRRVRGQRAPGGYPRGSVSESYKGADERRTEQPINVQEKPRLPHEAEHGRVDKIGRRGRTPTMVPQAYRSRRRWKKNSTVNKMVLTLDTVACSRQGLPRGLFPSRTRPNGASPLPLPLPLVVSLSLSLTSARSMSTLFQYGRLPSPFVDLGRRTPSLPVLFLRPFLETAAPPSLFEYSCNRSGRQHFVRTLSSTRRL